VDGAKSLELTGLLIGDEKSGLLQKRGFWFRKPPFYPLNYGDGDIFNPFDSLFSLRTGFYIFDCRFQFGKSARLPRSSRKRYDQSVY
jgi:hypothetical protein